MRLKVAMAAILILEALVLHGSVRARQAASQQATQAVVALPAIDQASLATLQPIVAHLIELAMQQSEAQSQYRVAVQAALNGAKLDPAYYSVRYDAAGQIAFMQIRQLPKAPVTVAH